MAMFVASNSFFLHPPPARGRPAATRPSRLRLLGRSQRFQTNSKETQPDLIPEENPHIDPLTKSTSGIAYGTVLSGLHQLYPPNELSKRNAMSRSDGYWAYIEAGEKPPSQFTYGEFDFMFFAQLIDQCTKYLMKDDDQDEEGNSWEGKTFLDIGSGTGRLVIGCAALHPGMEFCTGLEILPGIHRSSLDKLNQCRIQNVNTDEDVVLEGNGAIGEEATEDDGGVLDDDDMKLEYEEPIRQDMSEMQQTLQEMSAEEWKALLGDDYGDFFEDTEDMGADTNDKEHNGKSSDGSDIELGKESTDHEIANFQDSLEQDATAKVLIARSEEDEIIEGYKLPSDDSLVNLVTGDDEELGRELHFESIDEFLEMTQKDWVLHFGTRNSTTRNGMYNSSSSDNKWADPFPEQWKKRKDAKMDNDNMLDRAHTAPSHALLFGSNQTRCELPLAPINFSCGSFQDHYEYIGDVDIVFVFSSCMTEGMIGDLSDCIGRQLKPGAIVITTEFTLRTSGQIPPLENDVNMPFGEYEIELLDEVDGWNWITSKSTAYIQRVKRSLWDGTGPRVKPRMKSEEVAFRTIRNLEAGNLTNSEKFMRQVRNNMKFHDIPNVIQTQLDLVSNNMTLMEDENDVIEYS